ncbi:hypothetical protein GCM10009558_063380 [Virgisporangium aurantiacum]
MAANPIRARAAPFRFRASATRYPAATDCSRTNPPTSDIVAGFGSGDGSVMTAADAPSQ